MHFSSSRTTRHPAVLALALALAFIAGSAARAGSDLYAGLDAGSFRELPRAKAAIDLAAIDNELLGAAVFHETNRVRIENDLPALEFERKVRTAARMQSDIMAGRGSISHVNPEKPGRRTPAERLEHAGLTLSFAAENVATMFGFNHESGVPFYIREANGRTILSVEPDGPPIPVHTYLSFAEALVKSWMKSPGHRKNILNGKYEFLGCSCVRGADRGEMPVFYCTQVFFTPLPAEAPGAAIPDAAPQ